MKIKLIFFLFLCSATSMYAQQLQVKGTVISSEDDFPIAGANILIQGKMQVPQQILMEISKSQ